MLYEPLLHFKLDTKPRVLETATLAAISALPEMFTRSNVGATRKRRRAPELAGVGPTDYRSVAPADDLNHRVSGSSPLTIS